MRRKKELLPGFKNMKVEEVVCFSKSCITDGVTMEQTSEMLSCVDDLLSIQAVGMLINSRSGKRSHTKKKLKEVIEARIQQANF